jgi:hypothetical protein
MRTKLREICGEKNIDPVGLLFLLREAGHTTSYHTVVAWYYGYRGLRLDAAAQIAAVLGVPVDALVSDSVASAAGGASNA